MKYRLPTLDDYEILKEYVTEHHSNGENEITAIIRMTNMRYDMWVEKINRNSEKSDDEWGKYFLYLAFNDTDKLVGLLNIRYDLPQRLREIYGDIGYGVRPSERRKGYATEMLHYALSVCKEKKMDEVILGCYSNNYGSNKTIINNGGSLYRDDIEKKKLSDNWSIELKRNYYKIKL